MTRRSHEPWTTSDEHDLLARFRSGAYPGDIANAIGRTELAVRARLAKFRLLPPVSAEDIERYRSIRSTRTEKTETSVQTQPDSDPVQHISPELNEAFESTLDVQQAFHRFHFVYAIVNPIGQVYVGYAHDVWHRIAQQNRDLGAVATKNCGPWFPFAIYCFAAELDARSMELQIQARSDGTRYIFANRPWPSCRVGSVRSTLSLRIQHPAHGHS